MTLGRRLIQYNRQDLQAEPGKFEDRLFSTLEEKYTEIIQAIFDNIGALVPGRILEDYSNKVKRHLYPALVVSTHIQLPIQDTVNTCSAFVIGYSLPILTLDKLLDTKTESVGEDLLESLSYVYNANFFLLASGSYRTAYKFNSHYVELTNSLYFENRSKYKLPNPSEVSLYREEIFAHQRYYRSECHYLAAIVEGILETGNQEIDKELGLYLSLHGILRQVVDEIVDVEEDLGSGILTFPVLFGHYRKDISSLINGYWNNEVDFRQVNATILSLGGYDETYKLGVDIYNKCKEIETILVSRYPFIDDLSLFFDLRLAFLNRLKLDGWKDFVRATR